jgi:HAD superfamily hydrolase (TIGR01509 family)
VYRELVELGHLRPRAGVERLMAEARSAGIQLAIASTTTPANVESLLRASFGNESLQWFDAIATGDVVSKKKPAPDIYHLALTMLDLPPERAIAIEDSSIGVRSAKAAGLFTVATPSLWTIGQDFAAADLVLTSLGDPGLPLYALDEQRIGAKFLALRELAVLHAAASHTEDTHV